MKSYHKYAKEQRKKKQEKIDSMKPIERLDYLNRYDRIWERISGMWTLTLANYFLWFSIFSAVFSILLFAIETNNSMIAFSLMLEVSIHFFIVGIIFIYFAIFEILIKKYLLRKQINGLDEKYNI